MIKRKRFAALFFAILFTLSLSGDVFAQRRGSSFSSRPSSRPSSSFSSRPSSRPSTPKFGTPSSKPSSTPKFGTPSSKPSTTSSSKPTGSRLSTKAQSQNKETSRRYVQTQKAVSPPRASAVVNGQTVKVNATSKSVTDLRNRSSSYITPESRQKRYEVHVHNYGYSHPYSWYQSQPVSYGIGPYSGVFWWMMMEWSAERRAQWLYHHQHELSEKAYADAAKDKEVQMRLAALESESVVRDVNYIDPEFAKNPSDVYAQSYVEAAYNPVVAPPPRKGPTILVVGLFVMISVVVVLGLVYAIFTVKIGK